MFIAEARLSARLNHPNIVQVFDFGELDGGTSWPSSSSRASRSRRPSNGCCDYGPSHRAGGSRRPGIGLALGYAHALSGADGRPLDIVHRDVSPSNVMLGLDGTVKLLDFGVAKAASVRASQRARACSRESSYMPPEVVDGTSRAGPRSNLFAAGVVLHELLTGRRLFHGHDEVETLPQIRECVVGPPSRIPK